MYYYSNLVEISWFEFAKAIFDESKIHIHINPISTEEYPTLAKRPIYSVLDKSKIKNVFKLEIPFWKDSLKVSLVRFNYY